MKEARRNENDPATRRTPDQGRTDRGDEGAMSPSMRELILSFGKADSERALDADAYTRRPVAAAKL